MQGSFWLALICGVFTVISGIVWLVIRRSLDPSRPEYENDDLNSTRAWAKGITIFLAGLTAILVLASSFWIVGTQNVGVVTSFGKPVGEVGNGPQWTWPWQEVHDMDYSVQVTDFNASDCQIQLRLADGQTACAKVGVRWQINTRSADLLFRRYKGSTAGVENGVLIPALQTAANNVFASYDPVKLLNSKDPVGSPQNPTVPQLAHQVQDQLKETIGSEVTIDLLNMPNIAYSTSVQNRISSVLAQKAQTLVAEQAQQTANAQAAANRAISASVSHDPNVLTSRCLDLMGELIKDGRTPPVNMCNLSGSGSVIVGR